MVVLFRIWYTKFKFFGLFHKNVWNPKMRRIKECANFETVARNLGFKRIFAHWNFKFTWAAKKKDQCQTRKHFYVKKVCWSCQQFVRLCTWIAECEQFLNLQNCCKKLDHEKKCDENLDMAKFNWNGMQCTQISKCDFECWNKEMR